MKKTFLFMLIFLLIPVVANCEKSYIEGDFLPNKTLKEMSLKEFDEDGFSKAVLVACVGMSLNEDQTVDNDINLLDITNVYRVGVTSDYAVVVFEYGALCGLVCWAPGYAESYYFITGYENIDVINSTANKMCSSLTQINMQDMADVVRYIMKIS